LRFLGLQADPRFLLMPLPLLFAFASIYMVVLAFTYVLRSGPASGAVGVGVLVSAVAAGGAEAARAGAPFNWAVVAAGLLPRITPLNMQAQHLGAAEPAAWSPFLLTAVFTLALGLATLFAARRSES
jgi:hypothetical protein